MKMNDGQIFNISSDSSEVYSTLKDIFHRNNSADQEYWNWPMVSYLSASSLQRILNLNYLYDLQLSQAGSIMEFGVHYGSSFAQLINLRTIKEPHNYSRHIFGFDTFEGFKNTTNKDVNSADGDFYLTNGFEEELEKICLCHEAMSIRSNLKKFSLLKGDASESLKKLLDNRPELIISMAIFDMDIYKPTKEVLELILPRTHKGTILVFDQFNSPNYPGETEAAREVLNMNNFYIEQSPFLPFNAIFIRK